MKPLQTALTSRGYTELTPVQTAVTDPDLIGADMLVSAQTGSGKTVGFGAGSFTPLLQTNFLPLFTHVYLKPFEEVVWPDFLQTSPGLTALAAVEILVSRAQLVISKAARLRFTSNSNQASELQTLKRANYLGQRSLGIAK